jgi:hypothetical protein
MVFPFRQGQALSARRGCEILRKKTPCQTQYGHNRANLRKATSSSIQTVLSAPEFHRIMPKRLAGFTAGGELHPALKITDL